jgi:hypothetical protein
MKTSFKIFLLIVINIAFINNGLKAMPIKADSSKISNEQRDLKGFNAIEVDGSLDVNLVQGTNELVTVNAPAEKIFKYIKTEVHNGVLKIFIEKNNEFNWGNWGHFDLRNPGGRPNKIMVEVRIKEIKSIQASGSSNIYFKNSINCEHINLNISGSASASGMIKAKSISGSLQASCGVNFSGRSDDVNLMVSGSAVFNANNLLTDNITIDLQGSSTASIIATHIIIAHLNGNSSLTYTGSAKKIELYKKGNAIVRRI